MNPSEFVGRAPEQVEKFVSSEVNPIIKQFKLGKNAELSV